jgi:hypothetical protein
MKDASEVGPAAAVMHRQDGVQPETAYQADLEAQAQVEIYEGEFSEGRIEGRGSLQRGGNSGGGERYEGNFADGLYHGRGHLRCGPIHLP